MKQNHYFKRTLSAMLLLMASTLSWAYEFEARNTDGVTIYYNLINNKTEAAVTYGSLNYSGDIVIPSTVTYGGEMLSVTSIGDYAFSQCSSLTSVTIGNSVTSIGMDAFSFCTRLTSIIIPESVTSIGHGAFNSCYGLISVTIPENMTSIVSNAFWNCYSLTSIIIPKGVTSIGSYAFSSCISLTSISIPEGVTSIDFLAFYGCSSLTSVYSLIENPFRISNDVFAYIADDATLYVPQGTKEAYESTEGWKDNFSKIVEFNATGISEVNSGQSAEGYAVYGLNGTKVNVKGDLNSLPRGIYVVNGKKTIVK